MKENKSKVSEQVRIGRISYINVAPVYYGIDRTLKPDWVKMVTAPPADLNRRLAAGEIDISPVSSAAYAKNHEDWLLMPDLSISSFGEVMSVLLVSKRPLEELHNETVYLSEESASSADLVRYLLTASGLNPVFVPARVCKPSDVSGAKAALVIGDAALTGNWAGTFQYVYDLGELWHEKTGLPFVFAVWAVRKDFAEKNPAMITQISELFIESKRKGKENYAEIIESASTKTGLDRDVCEHYFNTLDCDLAPDHIKGLRVFFNCMYECGLISEIVEPQLVNTDKFQC